MSRFSQSRGAALSLGKAVACTALVSVLGACAALQPKTPEELVAQRAEARWAALVAGEFERAWTYTQPGYKAVVAQKNYAKNFGAAATWRGAQIHEVNCEPERCKVRIRLTTQLNMPRFSKQEMVGYLTETWVREDGQWWFYQSF